MRLVVKMICVFIAAAALTAINALPSAAAAAKEKVYSVGFYSKVGGGSDAQSMMLIKNITEIITAREGVKFEIKTYLDQEKFISAARKGTLDFAFTNRDDAIYAILKSNQMKPLVKMTAFGEINIRCCLYRKKKAPVKTVAELKGARVATYDELSTYIFLRKIINAQPEKYFELKASPNAGSSIYMLGLDDADAIFVADINVEYFKMSNPGPVKDIYPVACSDEYQWAPLFVSKKVPEALNRKLLEYVMNLYHIDEMKKYWSLFRMLKIKTIPVTEKDYAQFAKSYDEAKRKGWDKDFTMWLKYQKSK